MYIEIETPYLRLVPLGPDFLITTSAYALDPENTRYMLHLPNRDEAETLRFLEKAEKEWAKEEPSSFEFAVLYRDEQIGAVNLSFSGETPQEGARMGWIIRKSFWGHGFGPEAAQGLMDYFHDKYGIRRFQASCDRENTASVRTMEKLGMQKIGEHPGRKNRGAGEGSVELLYERLMP